MNNDYVHGYDPRENTRLLDQAMTLVDLLHGDTRYPPGANVLEAGCGVGAQTVVLAQNSPHANITSIDISPTSVAQAQSAISQAGFTNVHFACADIFNPPFSLNTFDHIFVCFVLEHLSKPQLALSNLKKLLKPGGSITLIEGDHGSAYFHPDSIFARKAIDCQVRLQSLAGGDACIGRRVFPLLNDAGFKNIHVSPRQVYVDGNRPNLIDGFTLKTFTAMIQGVREQALSRGLISPADFDQGIQDLIKTATPNGVFCYTFFKGIAYKE
jgi:SAM-dependent methyltransferase